MSNPRKFSEKIALHNQKQAEETAAFEQIMREVSGATRAPVHHHHHQTSYQNQHLYINPQLGVYRGGSLPNVNQIGSNSIDLQNALDNLESIKQGHDCLAERIQRDRSRHISHRSRTPHYDKRRDVSPYETSTYLSPPPDTSWRRTNSDSALHQSAMTPTENSPLGSITNLNFVSQCANNPIIQHRNNVTNHIDTTLLSDKSYWDVKHNLQSPESPHRPKSCEVPGINIYPSQEDSGVSVSDGGSGDGTSHIPITNSTGSLPDLTNLHFPSPLATPLDTEDQMHVYSTQNDVHQQPNALTPSSIISQNNHQIQDIGNNLRSLHTDNSSTILPNGIHNITSDQLASTESNNSSVRQHSSRLANLIIQSSNGSSHMSSPSDQANPQQYSQRQQQHPCGSQYNIYHTDLMSSSNVPMQNVGTSYRGGSVSPCDQSSCSAPNSPVSPSSSPGLDSSNLSKNNSSSHRNYFIQQQQQQTNALQHQFEHFNMLQDRITSANPINHMYMAGVGGNGTSATGRNNRVNNICISENSSENNVYYVSSSSPHHQQPQMSPHSPLSPHPPPYSVATATTTMNQNGTTTQATPQTPTTLPEIVLTAPGAEEIMMRQDFVKDLGNAMASISGSFDSDLFCGADEALRAGLDPIDFDGLQMLTDSDIPIDPATEETFRNDRL